MARGGSLKAKEIQLLTLMATGDKNAADDAFTKRLLEEMKRNPEATPDV
jgi:hypothetical protein